MDIRTVLAVPADTLVSFPDRLVFHSTEHPMMMIMMLSLIHISEPTRQAESSYAVFCLKKKNMLIMMMIMMIIMIIMIMIIMIT